MGDEMKDTKEAETKKIISVETETMNEFVKTIPDIREAMRSAVRKSGKKDKQLYGELDIDSAQWSRIMNGQANLSYEKFIHFMEACGNHIPIQWLAYNMGYELRVIPKTLEDQLQKEREEKERLQNKLELMNEVIEKLGIKLNS